MNNYAALPRYILTADQELKVIDIKRNNNNNNNSASSPVALTNYKIIVQIIDRNKMSS